MLFPVPIEVNSFRLPVSPSTLVRESLHSEHGREPVENCRKGRSGRVSVNPLSRRLNPGISMSLTCYTPESQSRQERDRVYVSVVQVELRGGQEVGGGIP